MSLVPTYIEATNGFFYKNPVLYDVDWFICFDDDDDPEIVIASGSGITPETVFNKLKIKIDGLRKAKRCGRVFPPYGKGHKFKPIKSQSWFFELHSSIPTPEEKLCKIEHGGRVSDTRQLGDCVVYIFNQKFI